MRIPHKRKRQGKTNYVRRLGLLVSRQPRLVIRKSLRGVIVQIISYHQDGDRILASSYTRDLKKYGVSSLTSNIPLAYLTGLLCGVRAKKAGVTNAIVDLGLQKSHPQGKLYAVVKGLIDAGITVPCDESVLPSEERISGKHMAEYAKIKGTPYDFPFAKIKDAIQQ